MVLFVRQLTDAADSSGPLTRAVALQFLFPNAPVHLADVQLWSSDYDSLAAFAAAVEDTDEFYYATESAAPECGDVVLEAEEIPPDEPAA